MSKRVSQRVRKEGRKEGEGADLAAVGMCTLVTAITQQQKILVVCVVTHLAELGRQRDASRWLLLP